MPHGSPEMRGREKVLVSEVIFRPLQTSLLVTRTCGRPAGVWGSHRRKTGPGEGGSSVPPNLTPAPTDCVVSVHSVGWPRGRGNQDQHQLYSVHGYREGFILAEMGLDFSSASQRSPGGGACPDPEGDARRDRNRSESAANKTKKTANGNNARISLPLP